MPYTQCYDLPLINGPGAGVWANLLRAAANGHKRIAVINDSWGIQSNGNKWFPRIQALLPQLLYGVPMKEAICGGKEVTYSLEANTGWGHASTAGAFGTTGISGSEDWCANTPGKLPIGSSNGQYLRLTKNFMGGTIAFGCGSANGHWPNARDDGTMPVMIEAYVKPYSGMDSLMVDWRRGAANSDYQFSTSSHTLLATEEVACPSTAVGMTAVQSGTYNFDWSLGNPIINLYSKTGSAECDVAAFRVIVDDGNDKGISLESWGDSGTRLKPTGAGSWWVANADNGPLFQLQNYDGIIINLGFNDLIGDSSTAATVATYIEDVLALARAMAGRDDIPIMFTGGNPCPSSTTISTTLYDEHRQYTAAILEGVEADGGPVMVLNLHGLFHIHGWNEHSMRYPVGTPVTKWNSGTAYVVGDRVWSDEAFGSTFQEGLQMQFECMVNHTNARPGSAGFAQTYWRPVTGLMLFSDGAHPNPYGGLMVSHIWLQALATLKAHGAGGGVAGRLLGGALP